MTALQLMHKHKVRTICDSKRKR